MYRTKRRTAKYLIAILVLLVGTAGADMSKNKHAKANKAFQPQLQKTSHLIGRDVYGQADEKLGNIEDIVLSANGESIEYAVLSYGGFLGFGDKLFAVPWSEFKEHSDKKAFVLNVRKDYLKDAPGFKKSQWPTMVDKHWAREVAEFYRTGKSDSKSDMADKHSKEQKAKADSADKHKSDMADTASMVPLKYRRVTQLTGVEARNYQGTELGDLDDLMVDMNEGKVAYGVLMLPTNLFALQREMAVVPWTSIEILPQLHAVRIDVLKDTLQTVAFNREKFPDLENPTYARAVYSRFEAQPYWETLGYTPPEGKPEKMKQENWQDRAIWTQDKTAWQAGSSYNKMFDPQLAKNIEGTIASVGSFQAGDSEINGLRLLVKTTEGQSIVVHAGPRPFMERQDMTFHYGDKIKLTAAPVESGWRTVYLASKLQKGDKTVELRSKSGQPKWNPSELNQGSSSDK